MSLYDAVIKGWRSAFPGAAVDQFLAEEGPAVRAARQDAERVLRERKSRRKLQTWLDGQASAGRDFDEVQLRWLDWMREDITAQGQLSIEHLGQGRYAQAGGTERAARIFGRRTLGEVVAGLNATLGWSACGCSGRCGGGGGGGCGCTSGKAKASVSDARMAELTRGAAPETADDFAAYDVLVDLERKADAESDEVVLARLLDRVSARIAEGEAERPVVAKLGLEYLETRAEAMLLRAAGWDAVPLLLERPALAVVLAPLGHVIAVRDAMGRLAIHPEKAGTLNHLFAAVRQAEEKVAALHEVIDRPARTKAQLSPFASELWARAREGGALRSARRELEISESEGRGLSGQAWED